MSCGDDDRLAVRRAEDVLVLIIKARALPPAASLESGTWTAICRREVGSEGRSKHQGVQLDGLPSISTGSKGHGIRACSVGRPVQQQPGARGSLPRGMSRLPGRSFSSASLFALLMGKR